jgi:uncharacterized protein
MKPRSAISGRRLLQTLLAWIIASVVIGTMTIFGLRTFAGSWSVTDGPIVVVVAEVYLALLLTILIVCGGFSGLRDQLHFHFTSTRDLFLALGVWIACIGIAALVYLALSPMVGALPVTVVQILRLASDMPRLSSADTLSMVFIIIRACLLAPLVEELLFRGLLFGWLRQRLSASATIVITTLLFAAIHFYPLLLPLAFTVGLGAGWVRERTGSTLNFFVAHIANNILFLAIAYVLVRWYGM